MKTPFAPFALGLSLGLSLLRPLPAVAADPCDNFAATGMDAAAATQFKDELFAALKQGSAKKVAAMVQYPIRVRVPGKKSPKQFKTARELERDYDGIFTSALVTKILSAPVSDTVCRDQGMGLASGTLWVSTPTGAAAKGGPKVVAINP